MIVFKYCKQLYFQYNAWKYYDKPSLVANSLRQNSAYTSAVEVPIFYVLRSKLCYEL